MSREQGARGHRQRAIRAPLAQEFRPFNLRLTTHDSRLGPYPPHASHRGRAARIPIERSGREVHPTPGGPGARGALLHAGLARRSSRYACSISTPEPAASVSKPCRGAPRPPTLSNGALPPPPWSVPTSPTPLHRSHAGLSGTSLLFLARAERNQTEIAPYDLIVMDHPMRIPSWLPRWRESAARHRYNPNATVVIGDSPRVTLPQHAGRLAAARRAVLR